MVGCNELLSIHTFTKRSPQNTETAESKDAHHQPKAKQFITMKLSLFSFYLVFWSLHVVYGSQLRGSNQRDLLNPNSVLCKMYTEDTTYENGESTETQVCAPVIDGQETMHLISIKLPQEIQSAHRQEIREGLLFVQLTHAEITKNDFDVDIAIHSDNEFIVIGDVAHLRHLRERKLQTTGTVTVAVVLISGKNSRPTATKADIENTFNDNLVNIKTQYGLCSGGKLKLQKANKFISEVTVSKNIGSGTTPASLVEEASAKLGGAEKLADKVFFCIPPGTGSWAASSSMNYWKAQFNDPFCTSVSAMAHEFGHLIGLPHSNENGARYGDSTGYMSRSYRNANWPRRCFNGANSGFLGWYKDKTLEMRQSDSARLVKLAGFVDYKKAASDEPVLIDLGNNKWVQYNHAKWFTKDTGEYPDHVIITEMLDGGTEVLGKVLPGETYTSGIFHVKACNRFTATNDNSADYMVISIGKGGALACPQPQSNSGTNGDINGNNSNAQQSQERETPEPTDPPKKVHTGAVLTPAPNGSTENNGNSNNNNNNSSASGNKSSTSGSENSSNNGSDTDPTENDGDETPFPTATPQPTEPETTIIPSPTQAAPSGTVADQQTVSWWNNFLSWLKP